MKATITCLTNLQNKTFKLLPMRELCDAGEDNRLSEYLFNLCAIYEGALAHCPALSSVCEIIEARDNVEYLRHHTDLNFKEWRAMVLRSTRLIGDALSMLSEESGSLGRGGCNV